MAVHILGIRHHGPGSARNVKAFLEEITPDIVLVEGPPDADHLLEWSNHEELKPPVSILVYQAENPRKAVFYPFAEFSPEWQAIQYAKRNNLPMHFMDLPLNHYFALNKRSSEAAAQSAEHSNITGNDTNEVSSEDLIHENPSGYTDPISLLAQAAGMDDGEKWWEQQFEYRINNHEVFEAVKEAMQALRETIPSREDKREQLREAYMRKVIRQAEKEKFQNIAVICGAWHAPALSDLKNTSKADNEILKGLAKVKTECTWTPWTYNRLSLYSGYGAGIESPGWYHHLWKYPKDDGTRWFVKVAKLLRLKGMDVSVAHVIEAVRLTQSLAAIRKLSRPGLEEMIEATLVVLCSGESILLDLIHRELIVSDRIGAVPTEIPKPPLQLDIEKFQKKLRLGVSADSKSYMLDLRKDNDLEKSIFLHRLELLEIKWGSKQHAEGKGTFKEQWTLQWIPSLAIDIIEKGSWGNTLEDAANSFVINKTVQSDSLADITSLLEGTIPAELPKAIDALILKIQNLAATSGDVIQLMEAIPGLVNVSRYGNVRKTDADLVSNIAKNMITRICISLPSACVSVNEDASAHLLELFFKLNDSINILSDHDILVQWQQTLSSIRMNQNSSPVISGYTTRLLYDQRILTGEHLISSFTYSMSLVNDADKAASWLEGFLKGSGTILLVDGVLWNLINNWVADLGEEIFVQVLPLLRRTFSEFTYAERRKLGEKVRDGNTMTKSSQKLSGKSFDITNAKKGIPVVLQLLGIDQGKANI